MSFLNWLEENASEILSVLLPFLSAGVGSAIGAHWEFKKMRNQWDRDDYTTKRELFSKMVRDTTGFCNFSSGLKRDKAVESISHFMSFETDEETSSLLQQLLSAVQDNRKFEAKTLLKLVQEKADQFRNAKHKTDKRRPKKITKRN